MSEGIELPELQLPHDEFMEGAFIGRESLQIFLDSSASRNSSWERAVVRGCINYYDQLRDALKRIADLEEIAYHSERWRIAYQEGKHKLYEMGGEVAEAAFRHLPCNEGPLDRKSRKILIEPYCAPIRERAKAAEEKVAELESQQAADREELRVTERALKMACKLVASTYPNKPQYFIERARQESKPAAAEGGR